MVLTFDCYGTLIDWNSGIVSAFAAEAERLGLAVDPDAVLAAYHAAEREVEARYRSYREVLRETSRRAAEVLGWPPDVRDNFLEDSLPSWRPFPDTNPALATLKEHGCKLGILSNVDDDLLAETRRHFAVPFDFWITAEQVRSYKPGFAHFLAARERIGSQRWIHVAQSWFHDVVPAKALGIHAAWINRTAERLEGPIRPDVECATLAEFAEWLLRPPTA